MKRLLLSLLFIGPAAAAARAEPACKRTDWKKYATIQDTFSKPVESLAADPVMTDRCKAVLIDSLADAISAATFNQLCPGSRCENQQAAVQQMKLLAGFKDSFCVGSAGAAACTLNPAVANPIRQADASLAASLNEEIKVIEDKIGARTIPVCLLPSACLGLMTGGGEPDCRAALVGKWWDDWTTIMSSETGEITMKANGFNHLLIGTAFTCGSAKQQGDTCGIYSAVNLMSHYCMTPSVNPAALNSCPRSGPDDIKCVGTKEFLAAAHASGAWNATECKQGDKSSQCGPATENPSQVEEAALNAEFAKCKDPACLAQVSAKLGKLRAKAGAGKGGAGGGWVSGQTGVALTDLQKLYEQFGFTVAYFPGNDAGWAKLSAAARRGDPVQVDINVTNWAGYGSLVAAGGAHAVVIEGIWSRDNQSSPLVLIRDSNDEKSIKLVPAAMVKSTYISRNGGAIGLCPWAPGQPSSRACPP